MLTRAWFAVCVLWAVLFFALSLNRNANEAGREWLYVFAVAPFLVGWLLKKVAKYIVTARL